MIEIRRILCPLDSSEASRHALVHAIALAKWYGSHIVGLYVVHPPIVPPPPIFTVAAFVDDVPPGAPNDRAREQDLRAWLEPARQAGIGTDVILDHGNPAARIVARAISESADLIVMGTHGLGGFDRFMLGSVAEKVLRKATTPVMTVPPASATSAKVPYTRLLCPIDFSESSLAALRFAFSLAKEADASLTLLRAFEWPPDDELLADRFNVAAFRGALEEDARARLEALVTDDVRVWCKPTTRVVHGKPYRQILEAAEREGTDLIVMGVRGRNPVDLALFGSTANHVVRRAPCPVLTLRQ
jgi:nucleotide-binding universal stress UspA family protein